MSEDLKVGDMVRCADLGSSWLWSNLVGTVLSISVRTATLDRVDYISVKVQFGIIINGRTVWAFSGRNSTHLIPLSPEETEKYADQQRRHEHAMRYL